MKRYSLAIAALCTLLCVFCDENGGEQSDTTSAPVRGHPTEPIDTQAYYDSVLSVLLAREDTVFADPENTTLVPPLLSAAFDTSTGAFYVAGKATYNPDYPEPARDEARKRAARYVGERWALYLKAWHTGQSLAFGTRVSGNIMYSKELYSREQDDTLYQLLIVPVGSVVLDGAPAPEGK
ncbi:MAG: hypothetical protein GF418_01880 [Chitinivibrionales bacterium]|nr:hypothetical protein [Chitinivibrionales bacterium]MBD3394349.1 hypothetical protein [Chitinivibrionales bacterium]